MKQTIWKYILFISLLSNGILIWWGFKPDGLNRVPPWHSFELNSELTFESIVEDGYRFAFMPCGQDQYTKQIGDTTIQYEVLTDCNDYSEKQDSHSHSSEKTAAINKPKHLIQTKAEAKNTEDKAQKANKYYPWNFEEIEDCYQKIGWRSFTINLGEEPDSLFIRQFIEEKNSFIVGSASNWTTKTGGHIHVENTHTNLEFLCYVGTEQNDGHDESEWNFSITSYIPNLNQGAIVKEQEYLKKKRLYHEKD